jgi:hypothetical protein
MNQNNKPYQELTEWVPLSKVVDYVTIDDYDDAQVLRQRFNNWAIRGYRKLNLNLLRKVKSALIRVNQATGTAPMPPDCRKVISAGYYDMCGDYTPIMQVGLIHVQAEKVCTCDQCKCEKDSFCNSVSYERTEEVIHIDGQPYTNVTINRFDKSTKTYKVQKEEWLFVQSSQTVEKRVTVTDLCQLETKPCGCIAETPGNVATLRSCGCCGAWDHYNRSGLCNDDYFSVDEEERQIHVGPDVKFVRITYWAYIPYTNGVVYFPAIAVECLAAWILYKRDQRRNISESQKQGSYMVYKRERRELRKNLFPIRAEIVLNALNLIPY